MKIIINFLFSKASKKWFSSALWKGTKLLMGYAAPWGQLWFWDCLYDFRLLLTPVWLAGRGPTAPRSVLLCHVTGEQAWVIQSHPSANWEPRAWRVSAGAADGTLSPLVSPVQSGVAVAAVWLRGVLAPCAVSSPPPPAPFLLPLAIFLSPLVRCVSAVFTTPGLFLLFFWAWGKLDSQPLAFWRLLRGAAQTGWSWVWWQVGCLWAVATPVDRWCCVSWGSEPRACCGVGPPWPCPREGANSCCLSSQSLRKRTGNAVVSAPFVWFDKLYKRVWGCSRGIGSG